MSIAVDTIPAELRQRNQWLGWRYIVRNGKATKQPMSVDGRSPGDSTDPATWGSLEDALAVFSANGLDGIGFVFTADDDFIGIDLDGCIQDGITEPWAQQLIERFDSYTEKTPSGQGLHIIIRGQLPPHGRRKGNVEVYSEKRFFTVTGDRMHGGDVEDRAGTLYEWHREVFGEDIAPVKPPEGAGFEGDDAQLVSQASTSRNGAKFARLWQGDLQDYNGDHSSADLALCSLLAFWTGGDAARMDGLFRWSKLFRPKWDEKRGEQTYGQRTIQQAVAGCREFYEPGMEDREVASHLDRIARRSESKGEPARPYVTNMIAKEDEDGEQVNHYVPPEIMVSTIVEGTGGWPRSAGGMMFVERGKRDPEKLLPDKEDVRLLRNTHALHGWLHEVADLHFARATHARRGDKRVSLITKGEFYEVLAARIERYDAVEMLPHYPPVSGIYYWPCELPQSDGSALNELLDHLNPETDEDRGLMLAALLTPGWGGPAGARPAFVLTSTHGRGSGKTATAELFARIWGGSLTVGEDEDWQQVKTRLLSDESFTSRVVLIDNIKGRMSRSGLESAITATNIDGKRMYVGQASRPNLLTWYITANTPELSRDLAERSVIIHVGAPKHRDSFKEWQEDFLAEKRPYVLADLMAILRGERKAEIPDSCADRWQLWQRSVLGQIEGGDQLARRAIEKRPHVDSDRDTAEEVAGAIRGMCEGFGIDPDNQALIVSTIDLHERLVSEGLRGANVSPQATTTWLKHHMDIEPLKACLGYKPIRVGGTTKRCWIWRGPAADPAEPVNEIPVYSKGASYETAAEL